MIVREGGPALSATSDFLESLRTRGDDPVLHQLSGMLRFDLRDGESVEPWLITVNEGEVSIARTSGDADCVATLDRDLSDRLATGEVNATAAALRGDIQIEGEVAILLAFQRLFPGPPQDRSNR